MKTLNCLNCNQTHPAGAYFCPVTGETIPEMYLCANCGQEVQAEWKACLQCGGALGEEPVVEKNG